MTEEHTYLVRGDDGAEYGPAPLEELREWVGENRVGLGTEVKLDDEESAWRPWHFYPELVALLAERGATLPPLPLPATVRAPLGRRFMAAIADLILCNILLLPLLFVSVFYLPTDLAARLIVQDMAPQTTPLVIPGWFEVLANILYFGGMTLYFAGFHAAHGKTPGKALLRLLVVNEQGGKPTFLRALLRALVLVVSFFGLWSIPLCAVFFNPHRRALHDLAAGTCVVEA